MHDTLKPRSFEIRDQEDRHYEQSPEDFRHGLTIFDRYVPVTPEMSSQPEYKMTFSQREQELAEGVRGTIEGFIDQAVLEGQSVVTFEEMFNRFDKELRGRAELMDKETQDEMFLVATKMKYNLEVRYNASKDRKSEKPAGSILERSLPSSSALLDWLNEQARSREGRNSS